MLKLVQTKGGEQPPFVFLDNAKMLILKISTVLACLGMALSSAPRAHCQVPDYFEETGIRDKAAAATFCHDLQKAVAANDKKSIASWIRQFPLQVEHSNQPHSHSGAASAESILVADRLDFVLKFQLIFDDELVQALKAETACDMDKQPDSSAKIVGGRIQIDQVRGSPKTTITTIMPPKDYEKFYEDPDKYEMFAKTFYADLRTAVTSDDRKKVAGLCSYPLRVNSSNSPIWIADGAELLANYDKIFVPSVRKAFLNETEASHVGWRGFSVEHGDVWFDAIVGTKVFRVFAINIG